jgi:phosphate transport system protein
VTTELRIAFHQSLDEIDGHVTQLFALVKEGLAAATDALLSADREAGRAVVQKDRLVDELYLRVEELTLREVALQGPVASDLRFLLSVLRIVPELERSGDLVEHIARAAARGQTEELTPVIRGLVTEMGRVGVELWRMAADAYAERDGSAARRIEVGDDEMDELHVSLTAQIASGSVSLPVAIEMALVGRFYERLGDHAVNIARRIEYTSRGPSGPAPAGPAQPGEPGSGARATGGPVSDAGSHED